MAVALRGSGSNSGGAGSVTIGSEPGGAANGDLILAHCACPTGTITAPGGFTQLAAGQTAVGGNNFFYWIGYQIRSGVPTLTWTGGSGYIYAEINYFTGADTTTPIDASSTPSTGAGVSPDPPSVTPVETPTVIWTGCWHNFGTVGGWSPPSGYTTVFTDPDGDGQTAYKSTTSVSAEDPGAWTTTSGSDAWVAWTYAIRGSDSAPPWTPESDSTYLLNRVQGSGMRTI